MLLELSLIFFYIQLSTLSINKMNLIIILISIELLFLSLVLITTSISFIYDDAMGSFLALILLIPTASESAIGLMLLINYFYDRGSLLTY